MKIECGNGSWIITVLDHERQQKFVTQANTWAEIPCMIERALAAPSIAWVDFKSYRMKQKPPEDKKR